jgi:hypothetical protein
LGQGHYRERKSQENKREAQRASPAIDGTRESGQQSLRHEFAQSEHGSALAANEQRNEKGEDEQSPEPMWRAESH